MRLWTYIKSLNETLLMALVAIVVLVLFCIWFSPNSLSNHVIFKCPSEYETSKEYLSDLAQWIRKNTDTRPEMTVAELSALRNKELANHKCGPSPWLEGDTTQQDTETLCSQNRWEKLQTEEPIADFEDYPIEDFSTGPAAPIDFESSFAATRYKTWVQKAVDDGVDFAGHYAIAWWGATGIGGMIAVTDLSTGKVFPFPYLAQVGFDYRKDSNLLIVDSLPLIKDFLEEDPDFLCYYGVIGTARPYYFVWENNTFRFLGPKDGPAPNDNDYGWLHP